MRPENPGLIYKFFIQRFIQAFTNVNDNIKIKISNFSNECYLTHHLFPEIKARQYYALEII